MDRDNKGRQCSCLTGRYIETMRWQDNYRGIVVCSDCGHEIDRFEYSLMGCVTRNLEIKGYKEENGIDYLIVDYYSKDGGGYRNGSLINIDKKDSWENKRDIKLNGLEILRDVCLEHKYVKVYHKALFTIFGTDGFGWHGPDNPLVNKWIYYFKDCRLHNLKGKAVEQDPPSSTYGVYYIDGKEIGYFANREHLRNNKMFGPEVADKLLVANDTEFNEYVKCLHRTEIIDKCLARVDI